MQVSNYTRNEKDILLTSVGPGLMSILLNYMASARLFIREEFHHAACTSISIMTSTRKGVKKKTYLLTIGQFHKTFGKSWGRRRRQNDDVTVHCFHYILFLFHLLILLLLYPCLTPVWTVPYLFIYFIRGCAPPPIIMLNHDDSILFLTLSDSPLCINTWEIVTCTLTYSWEYTPIFTLLSNLTS